MDECKEVREKILEEVVERTGCKKREVVIKALKQYFELNTKD